MNAGETFQQTMDIDFVDEKDNILVIYLYGITFFSHTDEDHVSHLLRMFRKCRNVDISLNPKKSLLSMKEGNLLGHIISQEGIRIDPKSVDVIHKIELP